ncbi:carbohydrate ABC transporter permease [Haloplasma contractile]|uniref:Binding-protein-dependent transport systems inner membrane component n=1 Tax=Haloplasma contractile SSD-17B TaxID=1033810 RepID=U2EDP3_9MOLU|nr:carbohydrate ABC transporter permease [Haloplasma contractile]ERJ13103.1 Binding-protein-dependent transport systems inner membrane component [Haloplasma contractile SSD-17B]
MKNVRNSLVYIFLGLASFVSIFPFFWMIIGITNTTQDITKGKFTFGNALMVNIRNLFDTTDIFGIFWNTSKIAIIGTLLSLLVTSMAAYGYELFRSRIRERIYTVVLLTMMIPFAALMIPLFRLIVRFGLLDTHMGIILPTIVNVFLIFFFRQSFKTFPREIIQAARIDGANEFQIFFTIVVPIMKSTYSAAAIYSFMANWNNYLWPLIVLQSSEKKTLTLMISSLSSAYFPDYGVIMVAIVIATLPMIIIFFMLQKHFVQGMLGSVKS